MSKIKEVIFTEGDYTFVKTCGVGMNDTPWTGLEVISDGAAKKHVIEVRFEGYVWSNQFEGEDIKITYDRVYVSHGMRSAIDSFADTEEYIQSLTEALSVARKALAWAEENGWIRK